MTRRQETSLPPPPPFTVLTHISQIIFPTAWSCFIFLHCLTWFWFVSKWIIVYAFWSLQICSHSEVNLCIWHFYIFIRLIYIVTHQGCTGPPSGASPCRACSCCAARSRAAPKDADQPEHTYIQLNISWSLVMLILMLTVCPPITPPIPLWLKNWELKYILLAACKRGNFSMWFHLATNAMAL